ncbi:MAG: hypothetical protein UFP03_06425 [Paludibacteraceae bacterium]|nr:hypothetical protein [Paludibacteraceae bacterium]
MSKKESENILQELYSRFIKPWCFSFGWHFISMIILTGGAGVIMSIVNYYVRGTDSWNILENIISYSLALVIPSAASILQTFNKTTKKVSLIEFTISIFIVIPIILSILSYFFSLYFLPLICMLLSWIAWVIANYENTDLNDDSFEEKIKKEITKNHAQDWN